MNRLGARGGPPPATSLAILAALALQFAPFQADARHDQQKKSHCSYYDPQPKCTEVERNARRNQFGLPTLDRIRQQHTRGRTRSELIVGTVKIKRGGGLALVFQRDRSGTPSVEIHRMLANTKSRNRLPISAKISETTWDAIVVKTAALELVYATDDVMVCGANFTIEFMDKAGNIRAPVGDSCGNEPRGVYFEVLAEAAIAELPHCAALVSSRTDGAMQKLEECFVLQGEKMVAAELHNVLNMSDERAFWETNGREDPAVIQTLFDNKIQFSWPGIPLIDNAEAAAQFWTGSWLWHYKFRPEVFHAESSERVRVTGHVMLDLPEDDGGWRHDKAGTFASIWQKGGDGKFQMLRFEYSAMPTRSATKQPTFK